MGRRGSRERRGGRDSKEVESEKVTRRVSIKVIPTGGRDSQPSEYKGAWIELVGSRVQQNQQGSKAEKITRREAVEETTYRKRE